MLYQELIKAPKYNIEIKGEIDKSTITGGDFNTSLLEICGIIVTLL